MGAVKKRISGVDPEFLKKNREDMKRVHRHVLYLNSLERAAIEEYCRRYKVRSKAGLIREAVMERVLAQLDESHPTLF